MTHLNIARQRLHNQCISQRTCENAVDDVVKWLGAVQAQDYAAAKWAVGLRLQGITDDDIEQAFTDGAILRTHVMRPTWHFVSSDDIRWMLALTAPRVKAASAYYHRRLELDKATFMQSNAALVKALQGGKQLTRAQLTSVLQQVGIASENALRFTYIIMYAELDGIICSGARRGKQFTYALLDERAPQARTLDRDEALAKLARRYFTSHGPATLHDFAWWSGLTTADAKAGLEMVASQLMHELVDGQMYWFSTSSTLTIDRTPTVSLLPNFDEFVVGYTDRSAIFNAAYTNKQTPRGNILFNHTIVVDGQIVGTWNRTTKKDTVTITPNLFIPLNEAETCAFTEAANRYGAFFGKSWELAPSSDAS